MDSNTNDKEWPISSPEPLIDICINLRHDTYDDWKRMIITTAYTNTKTIIISGTSNSESVEAIEMTRLVNNENDTKIKKDMVQAYCTLGIHPHEAHNCKEDTVNEFRTLYNDNKDIVVAIGETGIAFNLGIEHKDAQVSWFNEHIKLALELKLPLFLHQRESHKCFLEILDKYEKLPPIVVHCFTGTSGEAKDYIDRGFYIGLTTFVAKYERGKKMREILKSGVIPLDRIMVETDSPHMKPTLNRHLSGFYQLQEGVNEPATMSLAVHHIALSMGLTEKEVARATTNTSNKFFKIGKRYRK